MMWATALLGASMAWILVLALSASFGVGLIVSWQRWGDRVPLPEPVRPLAARVLGPTGMTARPAAAAPMDATPSVPDDGPDVADGPAEQPVASPSVSQPIAAPASAVASEPVATSEDTAPGLDSETPPDQTAAPSGPAALTALDQDGHIATAADDGGAAHENGADAGDAGEDSPRGRTDSVEEIIALLDVTYEAAVALFESGLHDVARFDEWARAMRRSAPPRGLDADQMKPILAHDVAEVAKGLEAFRARRAKLRELEALWGVGPAEAEALLDAGFDSVSKLRAASTEKLSKIEGIGMSRAFQIRAAAHGLAPTP